MKYAIISDIHANLEALTTVIDRCKQEGVEKYICLGDIVGYNANPRECLEIVRGLDVIGTVKGNHDEYVSSSDEEMLGFNQHAKQAVLWTKSHLNAEERDWLSKLPMKQTVRGTNITIVHATLDSPASWGYIFDVHHAMDNFSYQFTPLCFCGHSHVPIAFCKKSFTGSNSLLVEEVQEWKAERTEANADTPDPDPVISIQKGWKYLINIGSVGQPRNKDPRASFAIYDTEPNTVTRLRLAYDVVTAQNKIREVGLPDRLASRLERGN
jgi:predicted phosphodiesterase